MPEGGILSYGKERNWIIPGEQEETIWLEVYPGTNGEIAFYEDDAQSIAYQNGEYAKTIVQQRKGQNDELIIEIGNQKASLKIN